MQNVRCIFKEFPIGLCSTDILCPVWINVINGKIGIIQSSLVLFFHLAKDFCIVTNIWNVKSQNSCPAFVALNGLLLVFVILFHFLLFFFPWNDFSLNFEIHSFCVNSFLFTVIIVFFFISVLIGFIVFQIKVLKLNVFLMPCWKEYWFYKYFR